MLRSLFSAVTGMRGNQTKMDVVGNNIANVNTVGFKSSNVVFQDTLSQQLRTGTAPAGGRGGYNPEQVGLGVQLAGITTNWTQGAAQNTGRANDMMISGDGFFVVRSGTEQLYTRAGAFTFDGQGNLTTQDGAILQGYPADANGVVNTSGGVADLKLPLGANATGATLESYAVGADGTITGVYSDGTRQALGQVVHAAFNNPSGLEKAGSSTYRAGANSGTPTVDVAGSGGRGTLASGQLEMSNVDLGQEFTELIVAQRGFQANTRMITASDEVLQDVVNLKR
jgi:flagellar hook protein FlgE